MRKINTPQWLKSPLWIIVILLLGVNFWLWDISQKIGHDYIYRPWPKEDIKATGLYKAIYSIKRDIPEYGTILEEILEELKWMD